MIKLINHNASWPSISSQNFLIKVSPVLFIVLMVFLAPQTHAAGKVKAALGFGQVDYSIKNTFGRSPHPSASGSGITGGYGIILDFTPKNKRSSFALDYYQQNGGSDTTDTGEIPAIRRTTIHSVLIGGRWNARKHGFYAGGGLMGVQKDEDIRDELGNYLDNVSGQTLTIGATLGYDHKFNNGLILGGHLLLQGPTENLIAPLGDVFSDILGDQGLDSPRGKAHTPPRIDTAGVQQLSFTIGYGW